MKLQKKGGGAPSREPIVDAETQKAMMAWHYKKQEEQKVGDAWFCRPVKQGKFVLSLSLCMLQNK